MAFSAGTGRSRHPVQLLQIIEQWQALFEFFEVLAHDAVCLGSKPR
jgi:hypothetical protein